MKIHIIGGGPAGLFFARLVKRDHPAADITVFEQNPRGATYGFGVVFTEGALRPLERSDPELHADVIAAAERQDTITVHHRDEAIRIGGNVFYGIGRARLLEVMQKHSERAGVRLVFDSRITRVEDLGDCDLVVGADGINSTVRSNLQHHFEAVQEPRQNKWAWYAASKGFDGVHLMFKETSAGLFIGHSYRYAPDRSGFVVECDPDTWQRAGLDRLSDEESRIFCSEVFRQALGGAELLSNRSLWFTPSFVTSRRWYHENIVLIGDALKTVHPSIGSGTRVGMQDAVALSEALKSQAWQVNKALPAYVEARRPGSDAFQDAALRSIVWYETIAENLHLSPLDFAFMYMTRTGRVDYERLKIMDPQFVRAVESARQAG